MMPNINIEPFGSCPSCNQHKNYIITFSEIEDKKLRYCLTCIRTLYELAKKKEDRSLYILLKDILVAVRNTLQSNNIKKPGINGKQSNNRYKRRGFTPDSNIQGQEIQRSMESNPRRCETNIRGTSRRYKRTPI